MKLPELHERILLAIPEGKQNAIPISYLMEKLVISPTDRRKVNNIINDLIFTYEFPIGTSSEQETKGIFLIENEADLSLASHTMKSRAMSSLKREQKVTENYRNRNQLKAAL